jgi:flavodoxin
MLLMNTKVMYFSKGGNTKKIAEAIAKSFNQSPESVPPAYPLDNIKLLFLGSAVYGGKISDKVKDYIKTLNVKKVRNVALFSTTGNGKDTAIMQMKDLIVAQGINVLDESFSCKGRFFLFLNAQRPNAEDLKNAQDFAKKTAEKLGE